MRRYVEIVIQLITTKVLLNLYCAILLRPQYYFRKSCIQRVERMDNLFTKLQHSNFCVEYHSSEYFSSWCPEIYFLLFWFKQYLLSKNIHGKYYTMHI